VTPNVAALLEAVARRSPDRPALVWNGGGLTWRELDRRAGAVARDLARRGAAAGDTVALVLPNGWGLVAGVLGVLKLGATAAPLNPLLTPEERGRIVADLGSGLLVEEVAAGEAEAPARPTGAPALVLYTSGSTGLPKGVVLSHAAVRVANESWAGPVMRLTPDDVVLAVLPLAHSYGLNGALLAPLLAGACVAVVDRFAPETVVAAIERHRVTIFPGVATMFRRLLDAGADAAAVRGLRLAVSGAAPCPWELAEEWRRRTGVRLLRGYGMTELFRPISYLAAEAADHPDSIGRAVPGVELRVVEDELWIRTPAAMDGYLRAPEETAAVLADGWFKTGDLATISPDGYVRIVGRKRELILRGGYSVVPGEVEATLLGHPAVAEAAVIGVAHAELGEEVSAFVTLRVGTRAEAEELIAFCRARLAGYKYPRRVAIVAELPKSATGKILKARLRSESGG
jgi:long-chain acyl-CoA synthetase